jgi:8-hydroxy-5-deazaflavin:NADPH oxidoreductase
MRIGIIGSGKIGGTVGRLWAQAGHEVFYSSRHPEELSELARRSGPNARYGSIEEAASFGEAILLAVPYGALPDLAAQVGTRLDGKPVLDAGNPYPERDGRMAQEIRDRGEGSGIATARHLSRSRVVRAFNTVWYQTLEQEAHRAGDRVGVPLAGDDRDALALAASLVRDAGFDPVIVGGLGESVRFDVGTPVYNTGMSGPEVRRTLGVSEGREEGVAT